LIEKLRKALPNIVIDALPEKTGIFKNFESEFVSERRAFLERWINKLILDNRIKLHPLLLGFLSKNGDEFVEWKNQENINLGKFTGYYKNKLD